MAGTLGIFGIYLLFAGVHVTSGITVDIPDKVYKIARGDNVTIPCKFTPPAAGSLVVVSWTATADNPDDPEISIVSYFSPSQITIYKKYKGKVNLLHDIAKGIANLQLLRVTSADTRVYECKVEVPDDEEGSVSDTANLVVLVAPSTPICNIVGAAEYFKDIELTCHSEEGTPTPTYKWQSHDVQNNPRQLPLKATDQKGVLSLFNISKEMSGYYICTSTNEIRSAKCNVTLAVMPPSMALGTTAVAGLIAAAVGVALLVGIVICCYCRRRREKDEEYAMGTPEGGEFTDKDPERKEDDHDEHVNYEEERRVKSADRRDPPDDRSERSYDRRNDYDDRRDHYADRRDDRSDRRDRNDRDDRYDDRRDHYADRRDRDDRDDRYDDRRDRYDDHRDRYDDRRDRYSDQYDSRDRPPSIPPNKPKELRN